MDNLLLCVYGCQRWHSLAGSMMEYFKKPEDTVAKGSFSIAGATVSEVLDSKYKFCFEVSTLGVSCCRFSR